MKNRTVRYGLLLICLMAGTIAAGGDKLQASPGQTTEVEETEATEGEEEILDAGVSRMLKEGDSPEAVRKDGKTTDGAGDRYLEEGMAGEAAIVLEQDKTDKNPAAGPGADQKDSEEQEASTGREEGELVMTTVTNTLNVRTEPDEDSEKVGYLYADCGGTILERKNGWTRLKSGNLTGWAKDEYLLFGEDAQKEAEQVGRLTARVTGDTLRIRKEPSESAGVYDLAARGDVFELINEQELEFSDGIRLEDEWAAIDYEGRTGYVSAEYIEVKFEYDTGQTLEEIAERQRAGEEAAQNALTDGGTGTAENGEAAPKQNAQRQNAGSIPAGTSDAMLLAALIQCEAGNEVYEGQVAVGAVVVNRVRSASYPNTVSEVIYASGQFGPAGSGQVAGLLQNGNVKDSCIQAAGEALSGVTNVGSATHFRRAGSREGIIIGNHVFW